MPDWVRANIRSGHKFVDRLIRAFFDVLDLANPAPRIVPLRKPQP
jgi:hypothetical protein